MSTHRGDRDVTGKVSTTETEAVAAEVVRIFENLYQGPAGPALDKAFADIDALYHGRHPDYHACDPSYHDLQHILDVALTTARLLDGYERSRSGDTPTLPPRLFMLAVIVALFHDFGYLRSRADRKHRYGAEYTKTHVGRGSRFLLHHVGRRGMKRYAALASQLIHFTGYERPVESIRISDPLQRRVGEIIGTADIIAQMSDRCYLEKCRDRLYPEFVLGGLTRKQLPNGATEVVFSSGEDLLWKTPGFYKSALYRLNEKLGKAYQYADKYFGGTNPYVDRIESSIGYAKKLAASKTVDLRRTPPWTLAPGVEAHPAEAVAAGAFA